MFVLEVSFFVDMEGVFGSFFDFDVDLVVFKFKRCDVIWNLFYVFYGIFVCSEYMVDDVSSVLEVFVRVDEFSIEVCYGV